MFEYISWHIWLYSIILPFVVSLVIVSLIHPTLVKMALAKGLVDNPNTRKLQKDPVPVMGGLAVFFGIIVGIGVVSMVFDSYGLFTCVISLTIMMYIGLVDDLMGLSPLLRLIIELLTIAFVVKMDMMSINDLHGLFGIEKLPVYLSLPLCAIACLGIINSINMIDGVDGLSSGLCIMACVTFGLVFCLSLDGKFAVMAFLAAGALTPFFFHNVFGKTSKMFIGDSGTLMMGMLLSIFCMRAIDNSSHVAYNHPRLGVVAFCLSVLSVPVFDTLRVMTGRIIKGVSPFHADKSHLHHLFIEIGFSHFGTALMIITLNGLNLLCWLITYLAGGSVTTQFIVVLAVGLLVTSGIYHTVRRAGHGNLIYRCLAWLGGKSHVENKPWFVKLGKVVDNH